MRRQTLLTIFLLTVSTLVLGCARPAADPYSHHFGEAYWANRNASIANPNAGDGEPVMGLDGETTEGVMRNYRESQRDQEPVYEGEQSITGAGTGTTR